MTSPPARGLFRGAIMQSGSCATQTRATARTASLAFAKQAGLPGRGHRRGLPARPAGEDAARRQHQLPAAVHLRRPRAAGARRAGGRVRPLQPGAAADRHQPQRGPHVRPGLHRADPGSRPTQLITSEFGARAPAILARYPWSSYPSPYTAAYQIGDIWTDSGFLTGIGGCPEQNLAAQFAATTPTFFYQFDDLHAPGLNNDHPGYQWGAGHAMELAYLWPSFNNGYLAVRPAHPGPARAVPADGQVLGRVHRGRRARGRPASRCWPRYTSGQLMSLRPGDQTRTIPAGTFAAEHQCSFWDSAS